MSDAPLTVCPHCGAETFSKQLTAAGFQLKGSGWYATDFKGSGAPAGAAAAVTAGAATSGESAAPAASNAESASSASAAPAASCGGGCACH